MLVTFYAFLLIRKTFANYLNPVKSYSTLRALPKIHVVHVHKTTISIDRIEWRSVCVPFVKSIRSFSGDSPGVRKQKDEACATFYTREYDGESFSSRFEEPRSRCWKVCTALDIERSPRLCGIDENEYG